MALPKFYLEPRATGSGKLAINMFYSFYGQRLQYYTGIRIEPKFYKAGTKEKPTDKSDVNKLISESAPYASAIRANLKQIALDAQNIANTAKTNKIPVTKEYLRTELDKIHKHKVEVVEELPSDVEHDFVSYYQMVIEERKSGKREISTGRNAGKRFTHNSIKNYGNTLAAVKRYMGYMMLGSLPFETVNKDFYDNFKRYCFDVEQKEVSTFVGYVKDIKSIMNEVAPDTFKPKDFVKPGYEADTIYLNDTQIDKIASLDLSDPDGFEMITKDGLEIKVSYSTLEKVRDLALVGFWSGLRFSDFSCLDLQSIDGNFIKVKQIKTGGRVSIPVMAKLKPVLARYSEGLPQISNQRFNEYIKIVARLAGLTEPKTVTNTKGNTQNKTTQPLYKYVSSHCCRRSYATNMFNKGVPTMLIMNSTGHKSESAFLKYLRATNEDKAILMAEAMQKLGL
ncbi:tyrosine-type recombinase/integrase [Pedobacter sp. SAFR-022]|uniref:tyrosine-type recombinase/integrase n=1 Tax=Pedobacter sp. SAFR-022 TaxID=3436861 RepID=UPI003F7F8F5A